ncbi:AI-2E family transporter [Bacillus sp. E214]|uniref:AI-2E family transporter n=1 Tax=Bacillus sp. E214 TaxID=2587156 RepID=UPI00292A487B|nr:AI-2E family transporter [Bacillus sp. E214]
MGFLNIQIKWFYRLGFLLLLFIVLFVFYLLRPIWSPVIQVFLTALSPFIGAALISYLLHPLVEKVHQKGLHRGLAIGLIYLVFFGAVGYGLYKGIPVFINQMIDVAERAPEMAELYRGYIARFHSQTSSWPFGLHDRLEQIISSIEMKLSSSITVLIEALSGLSDFFIFVLLIPLISFYLLKDAEKIIDFGLRLFPKKSRDTTKKFLKDIDHSLGGYLRGQLLVCTIVGSFAAILFWLFGMKYPLLLSLFIGVTNIIPYFGPLIGAVPALLVAITMSTGMVIKVAIIIIVIQFLEGNVLSPIIMGKTLKLHPLIIIFALLVGGEISGILGLILAVPILAFLKVAITHSKILRNNP